MEDGLVLSDEVERLRGGLGEIDRHDLAAQRVLAGDDEKVVPSLPTADHSAAKSSPTTVRTVQSPPDRSTALSIVIDDPGVEWITR